MLHKIHSRCRDDIAEKLSLNSNGLDFFSSRSLRLLLSSPVRIGPLKSGKLHKQKSSDNAWCTKLSAWAQSNDRKIMKSEIWNSFGQSQWNKSSWSTVPSKHSIPRKLPRNIGVLPEPNDPISSENMMTYFGEQVLRYFTRSLHSRLYDGYSCGNIHTLIP